MYITNKVLATNEVDDIEGNNELIKKYEKLLKIRKSSKSLKLAKLRKNCQKVEIYLILALKKMGQTF